MTTTNDYAPSTSLAPYYMDRTANRLGRLWSNEKFLHDAEDVGLLDFFEGPGPNPTTLTNYSASRIWLRVEAGVTTESGDVLVWNGASPASNEDNWVPLTPTRYAEYLSQVVNVTRYVDTRDFGATADGTDHLLSERYGTLGAAQAYYPRATALTQSIDAMALWKAMDTVGASGGGAVHLGGGAHVINDESWITNHYSNVSVFGNGLGIIATNYDFPVITNGDFTDDTIDPHNVGFYNIRFSQTETLVNPDNTVWYTQANKDVSPQNITNNHVSAAIHHGKGDDFAVEGCSFDNFLIAISYCGNWDNFTSPARGLKIKGNDFNGCNFGALIWTGVNDWEISSNKGRSTAWVLEFTDDGTPDPPHLLYVTGGAGFSSESKNGRVFGNGDRENLGITGSSLKFKACTGLIVANNFVTGSKGGLEFGYCRKFSFGGNSVLALAEDADVAVSQGAIRIYGCSDWVDHGSNIELTGAGTQAYSLAPIPKTDFATPPAKDVPCQDFRIFAPTVNYAASGSSPLSAFYLDTIIRGRIEFPSVKRSVAQNMTVFNIQNNNADWNTDDLQILLPSIWADASDTDRHKTFFIETGATNVRILVDPTRLVNVSDRDSNFISDNGTGTIIERVMSFGNARKSQSGRTWNLLSTHSGIAEGPTTDSIFEIIAGNTHISSLRFGDVDGSGRGEVQYDHATETAVFKTNGTERAKLNGAGLDLVSGSTGVQLLVGGAVKIDIVGGLRLASYTAAAIADITHAVNTANKAKGKQIWDETNNRIMVASGSAAADPWYYNDGVSSVTPA